MTVQNLVDIVKQVALEQVRLKSFYIGNTWDQAVGKKDNYPNCWFEMPVLVDYNVQAKLSKSYTFSVNILMFPEMDNPEDEINKISQAEVLADEFLLYLNQYSGINMGNNPTGLSVKSINADNACGIRIDIEVMTPRECLSD